MAAPTKKNTTTESCGVDMMGDAAGTPKKMMKENISCAVIASWVEVKK